MASYVESILGPGESVTFEGRTTNWIYFIPWVITLLALAAGAFLPFPVILFSVGLGVVVLAMPFIRQKSTELVVTDRRVIAKFGLISRHTIEMRMSKIESIRVDQHVWERMGGYGTIIIQGTGGADEPIPQVRDPIAFKKAVEVQLAAYEDAVRSGTRMS